MLLIDDLSKGSSHFINIYDSKTKSVSIQLYFVELFHIFNSENVKNHLQLSIYSLQFG